MMFEKEYLQGLRSRFVFRCESCKEEESVFTEAPPSRKKDKNAPQADDRETKNLNREMVLGAINAGLTHAQIEELFCTLGLHIPASAVFSKYEREICEKTEKLLAEYLLQNGKAEREAALRAGEGFDHEGLVQTNVIVDGSWCTRSYGTRYRALSGCGVVIGYYSKKLLHIGVRNKFCAMCFRYRNSEKPHHKCFFYWDGPSTGMEADIIVEAFRLAPTMHKLKYKRFIADGDSNLYNELIAKVPYGRMIEKVECVNHACKCLTSRLYNKRKTGGQECSKRLTPIMIKKLSGYARATIIRISQEGKGAKELIEALNAIPHHFFSGDHTKCPGLCKDSGSKVPLTDCPSMIFLCHVLQAFETLTRRARLLIGNNTSNLAEYFMSIVAKLIGGKQFLVTQNGRYNSRVAAAGVKYSKGELGRLHIYRKITGRIPPRATTKLSMRKSRLRALKKRARKSMTCRNEILKQKKVNEPDGKYGPNATTPDLAAVDFKIMKSAFLQRLECSTEQIQEI